MILKIDKNTYVKYDDDTKRATVIDVLSLNEQKTQIETRLAELNDFSDEDLLSWAKKNYPTPNMIIEAGHLQDKLTEINNTLEQING